MSVQVRDAQSYRAAHGSRPDVTKMVEHPRVGHALSHAGRSWTAAQKPFGDVLVCHASGARQFGQRSASLRPWTVGRA
jgi:hypothetical protein